MRFGKTLQQSIYPKWRESYIDYDKLKHLLREQDEETKWTEEDESTYVEELVNTQLEKVNSFHAKTGQELKERTASCESKLEPLVQALEGPNPSKSNGNEKETSGSAENEENAKILREVSAELDAITQEVNELEKFSRINFTGFLKAAKKHDRLRPPYKVRPLLQVRLSSLPFNSEDYSPLLYRYRTVTPQHIYKHSLIQSCIDYPPCTLSFDRRRVKTNLILLQMVLILARRDSMNLISVHYSKIPAPS